MKKCEWTCLKKINEADEFETFEKIINCKIGISKKLKMFKVLEFGNMVIIEIFIIFEDLNCYEYITAKNTRNFKMFGKCIFRNFLKFKNTI